MKQKNRGLVSEDYLNRDFHDSKDLRDRSPKKGLLISSS